MFGYKEHVWDRWERRLGEAGVRVDSDEEFIGYLGARRQMEGFESSNLIGEFCWITRLLTE